jgi:hypothetical protein
LSESEYQFFFSLEGGVMKKKSLGRLGFILLCVCVAGMLAAPGAAIGEEHGDVCVDHFQPGSVCTANDVRIVSFTRVGPIINDCASAPQGFAEADFEVLVSSAGSPDRYDIGFFFSEDGNSAQTGSSCLHDFLTPVTTDPGGVDLTGGAGPWISLDGDQCGDINANTQIVRKIVHVKFACQDVNNNSFIDINACTSWDNNTAGACNGVADAFPSTKSKCSCAVVDTDIELPQGIPGLNVEKTPASQTVESGADASFTISVDNTGSADIYNIKNNVVDPKCFAPPVYQSGDDGDNILQPNETWIYTCTTNNVTAGFTNTATASGNVGGPTGPPIQDSGTAQVNINTPATDVPTMTEWGMIFFMLLAGALSVYYLRRQRKI